MSLEKEIRIAKRVSIDPKASIQGSSSLLIHSHIENVWSKFSQVNDWKNWNSEIAKSELKSSFDVGNHFLWGPSGLTIRSTFVVIEKGSLVVWVGKALWIKAIHVWRFEEKGNQTKVTTEESMNGFLIKYFFSKQKLEKDLMNWLKALKNVSEWK